MKKTTLWLCSAYGATISYFGLVCRVRNSNTPHVTHFNPLGNFCDHSALKATNRLLLLLF